MTGPFDYFVVFAEMRTGSNFLETNLNAFDAFECHGEAFNPHFIGYPNRTEILGVTQAMRDADPMRLIETIKTESKGLGGFRFFHDHDRRVLDISLTDPRCAKIVLTRNPVDSYVSWKIAQATGQWKLTNVKRRRDSKVRFDVAEFEKHEAHLQSFLVFLLNRLQVTGQTAFYVAYEDIQSLDVVNGLARFLGSDERLEALDESLKIQNPGSLEDKVSNYDEMERALSGQDLFNLTRTPNFEPRRGAAVPAYVTVARAHDAFCKKILSNGPGAFTDIRKTLRNFYKIPIPGGEPDATYDRRAHREAFVGFLNFLRANLSGQTNIRTDAHWASQVAILQGMAQFGIPDMVLREADMAKHLIMLAGQIGYSAAKTPERAPDDSPFALADIYDDEIEALVSDIYQRDYVMFGFEPWTG